VDVFDVTGRRVCRVSDGERPAGTYEARWSGRDAEGRLLPAGICFVRLDTGSFQAVRKVAKLGAE
jgi:hypothetical protein